MTGSKAFHDNVRSALRATRAGRRLSSGQVTDVGAAAAIAVADYRIRRRRGQDVPLAGAHAFAETLSHRLSALLTLIDRRTKAVSRIAPNGKRELVTGPSGTTSFTVDALSWRQQLVKWQARAHRESARLARPAHRPTDWDRLRLSCAVADALAGAAIKPTAHDGGAFVALLDVVYATVGIDARWGDRRRSGRDRGAARMARHPSAAATAEATRWSKVGASFSR